jgi:hypothetical protein
MKHEFDANETRTADEDGAGNRDQGEMRVRDEDSDKTRRDEDGSRMLKWRERGPVSYSD